MRQARRIVLAVLAAGLTGGAGCLKKMESAAYDDYGYAPGYGGAPAPAMEMAEAESVSRSALMAAPPPPPPPPPPAPAGKAANTPTQPTNAQPQGQQGQQQQEPAVARRIFYSGSARLRVDRVEEQAEAIVALIKAEGGYVEQQSGNVLTLRVPVEKFRALFDQLLSRGEVLSKNLSAQDITDAYTAVDMRVTSLKAMRDRLIQLLAKADSEEEKLALVQEIQRVTEELDQLEAQLRTLASLSSFSRITLELVPHEPLAGGPDADASSAFAWIFSLTPFNRSMDGEGAVALDVPEGLVLLQKKPWAAESADGARLWTTRLMNDPQGDAAFWIDAVKDRLARDFVKAETRTVGTWEVLRLESVSRPAYAWHIGVRVEGKHLQLTEAYFPTLEQEQRYLKAVEAVLNGGAS